MLYDERGLPGMIVDTSAIIAILKEEDDPRSTPRPSPTRTPKTLRGKLSRIWDRPGLAT